MGISKAVGRCSRKEEEYFFELFFFLVRKFDVERAWADRSVVSKFLDGNIRQGNASCLVDA